MQRAEERDTGRPPEGNQQSAGSQSSAGRCPGCGHHLSAQAIHPAASSPLEDSKLQPGCGQRAVSQPAGAAQRGRTPLSAERPKEDQPHHRNRFHTQDV